MGLSVYFCEVEEKDYKRNDDDGTITVLSSKSLRTLYSYIWYSLSEFIREMWYPDTHSCLDFDEYISRYVLLVPSDIDLIEEFARNYNDIDSRIDLLAAVGILRVAINNGKHILCNIDG